MTGQSVAVDCDELRDGRIVPVEGGSVGGDVQVGPAWSARYTPADNATRTEHRAVTVYVFATDEFHGDDRDEADRFYDYCVMTEYRRWTGDDEQEGEVGADYEYSHPSPSGYETIAEADEAAKAEAATDLRQHLFFDAPQWERV